MKKCEKCGKEIMDDATLCEACAEQTDSAVKNEEKKTNNGKKKNKMKIILPIVGVGAVILAIVSVIAIFVGIMLFSGNSNENVTENPTIEENDGIIEGDEDVDNEESNIPQKVSVKEYLPTVQEMNERLMSAGLAHLFNSGKLKGTQSDKDGMMMLVNQEEVAKGQLYNVIYEHMKDIPGFSREFETEFFNNIENGEVNDASVTVVKSEFEYCGVKFKVDYMPCSYPKNMQLYGFDKYIFYFTYGTITLDGTTENQTEKNESTQNSSAQSLAPVIGGFSYNLTYDSTTKTLTDPVYPYLSNLRFKADGTCVVTVVADGKSGSAEGVWELSESECRDTMLVYRFQMNDGDESMPIYYDTEADFCMILGAEGTAYHYQRYTSDK